MPLRRLRVEAACLVGPDDCLGVMTAEASPHRGGGWRVGLQGDLLSGYFDYRPALSDPLDIALTRLRLDGLLPTGSEERGGCSMRSTCRPNQRRCRRGWPTCPTAACALPISPIRGG
ncbi:hypothetical protein [Halomonas sp. E19]|uniref:hypothetical protein n=1 Tax=Halomonas sp. E19 TaxID=3397247 RepID=UPI0040344758